MQSSGRKWQSNNIEFKRNSKKNKHMHRMAPNNENEVPETLVTEEEMGKKKTQKM